MWTDPTVPLVLFQPVKGIQRLDGSKQPDLIILLIFKGDQESFASSSTGSAGALAQELRQGLRVAGLTIDAEEVSEDEHVRNINLGISGRDGSARTHSPER